MNVSPPISSALIYFPNIFPLLSTCLFLPVFFSMINFKFSRFLVKFFDWCNILWYVWCITLFKALFSLSFFPSVISSPVCFSFMMLMGLCCLIIINFVLRASCHQWLYERGRGCSPMECVSNWSFPMVSEVSWTTVSSLGPRYPTTTV